MSSETYIWLDLKNNRPLDTLWVPKQKAALGSLLNQVARQNFKLHAGQALTEAKEGCMQVETIEPTKMSR